MHIRNEKNKVRNRAAAPRRNAGTNAGQASPRILNFTADAFDKMVTKDGKPAAKPQSDDKDKAAPLPSAPYSSAFVGLHRKLQDAGLSSETASQVVGGSYGNEDLENSLSEEEAGIVADVLGAYLQDEAASSGDEE